MPFRFSTRSRANLLGVHADLVAVVERALTYSRVDFTVIEGLRTIERQRALVAAGASQTMASRHLSGHAVDLAPWIDGTVRWDMGSYYALAEAMQRASRELAVPVTWGACWARLDQPYTPQELVSRYTAQRRALGRPAFIDAPHFEMPR